MSMRSIRIAAIFLLGLLPLSATANDDFERNIMTGGPTGTYIQIGRDIAALGQACGLGLNVVESAGSLENFSGVRNRRATQFGIVQNDVLEYLKTYEADDREIQQAIRGMRIMYPLYNEEVHVIARRDITSLRDLAGKRVATGKTNSGTNLTATLIMDIVGVDDAQRLPVSPDEALPMLLRGEIDAMFMVAGVPIALFADAAIDGERFHIVPITEQPLLATYTKAAIPAGTYAFQREEVDSIAVKAVLMTFEYQPQRNTYQRDSCKSVSDFARLILDGRSQLEATGHPKWKQVDLTAVPPGWQVSACVKAGLEPNYKPACTVAQTTQSAPGNDEYLELLRQHLKP